MTGNKWTAWFGNFVSLFTIYGAAHAGVLSDLDGREEDTWLGIG